MQASRSLTTSSLSKLVAWKPSLSGSLLGPALQHSELTRQQVSGGPCHDYLLTYSSFCCGCKCFAAGRSDEGLLTEPFSIGRRHTSLKFSVNATGKGLSLQHCLFSDLSAIPDFGKCFSGNSDGSKCVFGFFVYHLLQQIFQENNTFGDWMYQCVKSFFVTPSLHQCTSQEK